MLWEKTKNLTIFLIINELVLLDKPNYKGFAEDKKWNLWFVHCIQDDGFPPFSLLLDQ